MKQVRQCIFILLVSIVIIPFGLLGQSINDNKKRVDTTFQTLKLALETSQKEGISSTIAQKHLQLGKFYQKARIYNEVIEQYNQALTLIEEKDTLTVLLKNEIGKIYLSLKNNTKAKRYFNESISIASDNTFIKGEAIARGLLGSCFEKEREYLEALKYQKESLLLFNKLDNEEGIAVIHENIGSIYEDLEQYDLAFEYFKKADKYFEQLNNIGRISVLNNLGDVNRKTGNYTKALFYTFKAFELADYYKDKYQLKSAHKDLSKTYDLLKDYKKALDHLTESERINEELVLSQNINQLNTLQVVYETKQKEIKIDLLLQQKKTSRANQDLLLVSLGTTLLTAGFLFLYFRRKRKESSKLQEYEQRILKAELEKKEIEEKNLQRAVHVKTSTLSRYSLHLSQKNKMLSDLSLTLTNIASRKNIDLHSNIKKLAKEIEFNLKQEREWDEFNNFFKEIHPDFIKKLSSLSEENLSPAELRLGMLLRLNLSSKEIASILRVTPDSVRVARYRLRKKLPIDQKEELVNFMIAL
ncbi:tetratricopeptide repeat protein [Aquimarina sp. 2201CG5-10]|uniref:tetratricopeptide repeat protein n=1 Tax=Aquimarina callyspongiae TaxID=3098150 RepID=UPI002AB54C39|nr:tetratricopeptide repeat protein [Aquimarina sp. 2201CG5-10]MDY8135044.1 tetratricopeptide repeat protein [Aquimarina sp. 2201CG5-10]